MSVNNVDKILSYIYPVIAEPIKFKDVIFPKIEHIFLRKSLFYTDSCQICGKCCVAEDNIFLPFEVDRMDNILAGIEAVDNVTHKTNNQGLENIQQLRNSLKPLSVEINNKDFLLYSSKLTPNIYTFPDRGTLKRCHWDLPTGDGRLGCGIHQVSSLTCQMPHIRFLYRKDRRTTHIGTMQYGRNWAMKCPVVFDEQFSMERVNELLWKFDLLEKYCNYFRVKHYVPNIIRCIEQINCEADINSVCNVDILSMKSCRRLF